MKVNHPHTFIWPLIFIFPWIASCGSQGNNRAKVQLINEPAITQELPLGPQIAEYVRHIFQDKTGDFWFGTNGNGIAHYDGKKVSYYSIAQGFHGQQVTGIAEDIHKNLWFATDLGIVKYDWSSNHDGSIQFTNYSDSFFFDGQRFWSICADSKGNIWGGATRGIFRYDGEHWTPFPLPLPKAVQGDFITEATSWSIKEDRAGNMWFSTNGFGAYKYDSSDGHTKANSGFTQYSEEDGLTDDSVDDIIEDRHGNIWFGTRFGGVSKYDGKNFMNFSQSNGTIGNDEVCVLYEDSDGDIWFSSEGFGVYRYDGKNLTNFAENEGLGVLAVQTIFEDKEGRLWVGGGGGLYRFISNAMPVGREEFVNVTKYGPWD